MQRDQIDARSVEPNAPAEHGDDEGRPDDARTVDGAYVGRRHSITNSRRVSKPRRRYRATAGPLSGPTCRNGRSPWAKPRRISSTVSAAASPLPRATGCTQLSL